MTTNRTSSSTLSLSPKWNWALWLLHALVVAIAVGSLCTGEFDMWIDLRMLGGWGAVLLEIIWVGSTVLVPWCAGPIAGGWLPGRKPVWKAGYLGTRATWLLWPTYILLACMLANTVYYFRLLILGAADGMTPLPLVVGAILTVWVLLVRQWLRETGNGSEISIDKREAKRAPAGRLGQALGAGAAALIWLIVGGTFLVHAYRKPPRGPVDLAVVLGGRMRADGTASAELADRVQVAITLYQRGLVKHILLSGGFEPVDGTREVSEVAAMWAVCHQAGIPDDAISLDPVGVNTKATAYNTRILMAARGYATVVACSTDYHLYRTALSFRQEGVDAFVLPADPAEWRCADMRETLRELIGVVTYQLIPHYREPKGELMELKAPHLIVFKSAGRVELYDGGQLVKTYTCITGGEPGDKEREGDRKTPIGTFRIVYKNPLSKYHLSLGLDYPNQEDAKRGLAAGMISKADYDGILEALESDLSLEANQKKLWYTKLGGEIFIHGYGEGRTGTAGCVALKNTDVDELYAILPINTGVEIRP